MQLQCRSARMFAPSRRCAVVVQAKGFGFGSKATTGKEKSNCPCGSGKIYSTCCKKLHDSANGAYLLKPQSAEECLRARFSAYALKNWKMVVQSTAAENPARKGSLSEDGKIKTTFEQDVKVSQAWLEYKDLAVLASREQAGGEVAIDIEYQIKQLYELKTGKPISNPPWQVINETSVFGQEEGAWVFKRSEALNWDRNTLQKV